MIGSTIGHKYFYTIKACRERKSGVLVRKTNAWYIFDNGDYVPSSSLLFERGDDLETITTIAEGIKKVMPPGEGFLAPFRNTNYTKKE